MASSTRSSAPASSHRLRDTTDTGDAQRTLRSKAVAGAPRACHLNGADSDAARGVAQGSRAALEGASFVRGHARLELSGRALAPDHGGQPDRHAVARAVGGDLHDDALVAEDRLGD